MSEDSKCYEVDFTPQYSLAANVKNVVAATMAGAQHLADLILIVLDLVGPFLFLLSSVSPIDPPSGLPSVYGRGISD